MSKGYTVEHEGFGTGVAILIKLRDNGEYIATTEFDGITRMVPLMELDFGNTPVESIESLVKNKKELNEWQLKLRHQITVKIDNSLKFDVINSQTKFNKGGFCGFIFTLYNNINNKNNKKAAYTGYVNNKSYNYLIDKVTVIRNNTKLSFVNQKCFRKSLNRPANSNKFDMLLPYYLDNIRNREHIGHTKANGDMCHTDCVVDVERSIVNEPKLDRFGKHSKVKVYKINEDIIRLIDQPYWSEANEYCIAAYTETKKNNNPEPLFSRIFTQQGYEEHGKTLSKPRKFEIETFVILYRNQDNTIKKIEYFEGKLKLDITNLQYAKQIDNKIIINWSNKDNV